MIDLSAKLSEHFILPEFVTSQMASRLGIDNTPNDAVIEHLRKLCETILEPARLACGALKISSGYRCAELNKVVGGAANSGHLLGWCADVIPLEMSKLQFAKWVLNNRKFDQLILEFGTVDDPDWVHVSSDPRSRGQVLRILNAGKYEEVSL